jgi:ribosomal protein S18 acetylase RimI-like enzyme
MLPAENHVRTVGAVVCDRGMAIVLGQAITVAAAVALQELGSSSAIVCTPSFNVGAVATYKSAGFQQLPEVRDRYRDA